MPPFIDLTGKRYGNLRVVRFLRSERGGSRWQVLCDCGKPATALGPEMRSGHTKTCGCKLWKKTHGDAHSRFYDIWVAVKYRSSPDKKGVKMRRNYGHVKLCPTWASYEAFKRDMYRSYVAHVKKYGEKQTTIDRIDPTGGYSKLNCRWATYSEQNKNKR